MNIKFFLAFTFAVLGSLATIVTASGQIVNNYLGDETTLFAETKQVGQFFRRFNSEEDKRGKKLFDDDERYHNNEQRRKFIPLLFDGQNTYLTETIKQQFAASVTDAENPQLLDFHGENWLAEVNAVFLYKGKRQNIKLFLTLQEEALGAKWVIKNIFFKRFSELFYTDTTQTPKFLHPQSHELDFMNLIKVFQQDEDLMQYTARAYQPDFLTLFIYEFKKGNLVFETVEKVKFHFFQIEHYYFEVSSFNRTGYNSGWLISNLTLLEESQKTIFLKYIYRKDYE